MEIHDKIMQLNLLIKHLLVITQGTETRSVVGVVIIDRKPLQ